MNRLALFSPSARRMRALFLLAMLTALATAPTRAQIPGAAAEVAYVSAQAPDPGKLGEAAAPFASLQQALAAGAGELRIAPGVYDEGALVFADGGTTTLRLWNGRRGAGATLDEPGEVEIRGVMRIDGGATVILADNRATFRLRGDLFLDHGVLAINRNTLELDAKTVFVGAHSQLQGAGECTGGINFTGTAVTDLFYQTVVNQLVFTDTALQVSKDPGGGLTINANGVPSTIGAPNPPNNLDVLEIRCFRLNSGDVELRDGLDLLDIFQDYTQIDGTFTMAGLSSPAGVQPTVQKVRVGIDFREEDGEFRALGGDVEVSGDFLLGPNQGNDPGDALFSLEFNGVHTVVGDFRVGPNTVPDPDPNDPDSPESAAEEERNRYYLGEGDLNLFGDYTFEGSGDNWNDNLTPLQRQGLRGEVFFVGNSSQAVFHRQDEDAFFEDVILAGEGGVLLNSDGWQNDTGILLLELGILDTNDEANDWIILNPDFEPDLVERNNSARGKGVVDLGSRDSYINGEVDRRVEFGNATGGIVTGGYLFPVGAAGEEREPGEPPTSRDVDFFRPLILQFPDDLGRTSVARVDYRQDLTAADCDFDNLAVDAEDGETLTLDVIGEQFWQLQFDNIPSLDPNVRVEASGLPNIFDIKSLRLIQWDCDCQNPQLAGVYDTERSPEDDDSFLLNDFIDGVPNLTQEGVEVEECNIIGIASNFFINPINLPGDAAFARAQIIHNAPDAGPVDIYFDGQRVLDDFAFQTATPFLVLPGGTYTVDVVAGNDPDNSNPLGSSSLTVVDGMGYAVIATGLLPDLDVVVVDNVRLEAAGANADFFFFHGAPDAPPVDIQTLDPADNNTVLDVLADDLAYLGVTGYQHLAPGVYNVQAAAGSAEVGVFQFDLTGFGGQSFIGLASGLVGGPPGFSLIGFDVNGDPVPSTTVTAAEDAAALPEAFTLRGNYPNPFNPTTTLVFDLPETASVRVEVVDLLGRAALTLPAQQVEAGTGRTLEVNAAALASGAYFYRVTAQTATRGTLVKTGRMVVVK